MMMKRLMVSARLDRLTRTSLNVLNNVSKQPKSFGLYAVHFRTNTSVLITDQPKRQKGE
jgi:hypothetical protein